MKMYILSLVLVVAAPLALDVSPARAVTIDFESLRYDDADIVDHGTSYSEDGFTLSNPNISNQFHSFGTIHPLFTDSTALIEGNSNRTVELTRDGGGSFSLDSIDLAGFIPAAIFDITYIGDLIGGGTAVNTFTLDGAFGFETFTFTGFSSVTKVSWVSPAMQFDNIVVTANNGNAVPEPASLGLLGLGLAGLALIRRGVQHQRG